MEDHRLGLLADGAVVDIAYHAYDLVPAARSLAAIAEAFSDRVSAAEESAREGPVDQRDEWSILAVLLPELTTGENRNAGGGKESGTDQVVVYMCILRGLSWAFDPHVLVPAAIPKHGIPGQRHTSHPG